MPISPIFRQIEKQLQASRVFFPTGDEIKHWVESRVEHIPHMLQATTPLLIEETRMAYNGHPVNDTESETDGSIVSEQGSLNGGTPMSALTTPPEPRGPLVEEQPLEEVLAFPPAHRFHTVNEFSLGQYDAPITKKHAPPQERHPDSGYASLQQTPVPSPPTRRGPLISWEDDMSDETDETNDERNERNDEANERNNEANESVSAPIEIDLFPRAMRSSPKKRLRRLTKFWRRISSVCKNLFKDKHIRTPPANARVPPEDMSTTYTV